MNEFAPLGLYFVEQATAQNKVLQCKKKLKHVVK